MIRILLALLAGTSWAGPLRTAVVDAPVVPITGGLSAGIGSLAFPAGLRPALAPAGVLPSAAFGLPSASVLPSVAPLSPAAVPAAAKPSALPALQAVGAAVGPQASRQGASAGNTLTRAFDGAGTRGNAETGAVDAGDPSANASGSGLSPAGNGKSASIKGEPPDQPAPPQQPVPPQQGGPLKTWQIVALVVGGIVLIGIIGYLVYDVGVKLAEWLAQMEAGLRAAASDPFWPE